MPEFDHLSFVQLDMAGINRVGMHQRRLMHMRLGAVLMSIAAVIVVRSQMRVRRRTLSRQKGGQENVAQCGVDALPDHEEIEFKGIWLGQNLGRN